MGETAEPRACRANFSNEIEKTLYYSSIFMLIIDFKSF